MPALDSSIRDARQLFDVNFFSVLETMKAFGPMLVNAEGCVVNNASVGGFGAFPFGSKHTPRHISIASLLAEPIGTQTYLSSRSTQQTPH